MSDFIQERGKALENQFFRAKDQHLLDQIRQEMQDEDSRKALAAASGIQEEGVLAELVENHVSAESLTSVSLIPLVAVAWADHTMEANERRTILTAATSAGIEPGSVAYQLVESWLEEQPAAELFEAWKHYIAALRQTVDGVSLTHLKTSVMKRAREVADSAGGILGIGRVSEQEKNVLDEMEAAFDN
ncbi:MAG: hypothetical protein MK108_17270 [Mariniblastus sp.]|nr:hypothetical protein [Mariniblastus sp.]